MNKPGKEVDTKSLKMSLASDGKGLSFTIRTKIKQWISVLKTVNVEPAAFLMMGSILTSYLLYQDLILQRVCRVDLKYDEYVCSEIKKVNKTFATEETEVQKISANIRAHRSIIDHSVPIFFVLFFGPWSDIHGRKFPMLLAIFGYLLQPLVLIAGTYLVELDGYWIGYMAAISRALCGGESVYTMAAYSYISDTTDKSVRTIRTGLLSAGYTLGVPFGFAVGGAIIRANLGFAAGFAISASFSTTALLIVLFTVKNTKKVQQSEDSNLKKSDVGEHEEGRSLYRKIIICSKQRIKWVFGNFGVLFKRRDNSERLKIWLLICVYICVASPIHGEFGVMYLFLRSRLGWNGGDYGYFAMYISLCGVFGVVLSMGILVHWLKLSDPIVGFIAGISQFGGCVIYAIAYTTAVMLIAPAVDMMNGTMHVIARSMMSKIVLPDEVGKLFSTLSVLDSLVPLGMDPIYSTVYRLTVDVFSGYFWVLSAALTVPPQIIYAWLIWRERSEKSRVAKINSKNQMECKERPENGVINQAFSPESGV